MGQLLGRLIQHARFAALRPIPPLPVAVVEATLGAATMPLVGPPRALASGCCAALLAAVQPPVVTRPADAERPPTPSAPCIPKLDHALTAPAPVCWPCRSVCATLPPSRARATSEAGSLEAQPFAFCPPPACCRRSCHGSVGEISPNAYCLGRIHNPSTAVPRLPVSPPRPPLDPPATQRATSAAGSAATTTSITILEKNPRVSRTTGGRTSGSIFYGSAWPFTPKE